jgi:hypothetical protein
MTLDAVDKNCTMLGAIRVTSALFSKLIIR